MIRYVTNLTLTTRLGEPFRLGLPFEVQYRGLTIVCPAGMVTDGASIPRFFWRVIGSPWSGLYREPAVVHDGLYAGACWVTCLGAASSLDRAGSDLCFLRLMAHAGVGRIRRWAMYWGVRIGGRWAWSAGHG